MSTPTYNSDGEAVWKPQPGQYFPGGLRYVQSYGGVVSALQDIQVAHGDEAKSYPKNFAGIISAIEDLSALINGDFLTEESDTPDGWEISGANWQVPPPNGSLWFDTRQGRLFIAIDQEYYQTNGADGIAHVGPNAPTNPPVVGQQWLDTDTGILYVYIGDGNWQGVVSDGVITLTTDTLPLAVSRSSFSVDDGYGGFNTYSARKLPALPTGNNLSQRDLNDWLINALVSIDQAVSSNIVTVGPTEPTNDLEPGRLWFDTVDTKLKVYNSASQWVAVKPDVDVDGAIAPVETALNAEVTNRTTAISDLNTVFSQHRSQNEAKFTDLEADLNSLEAAVNAINVPDLSQYLTSSSLDSILNRVTTLENKPAVDLTGYASSTDLSSVQQTLTDAINAQTHLELSDITPLIPDVSAKVEQSDIDTSIAAITTNYLPRTGGTLTGSFVLQKEDYSLPAFDFTTASYYGNTAFKFLSNAAGNNVAKFGTNETPWEYSWDFDSEEDFCWNHGTNGKQFSINKNGATAKNLFIADFLENDATGQRTVNSIDVKSKLSQYDTTLATHTQQISDIINGTYTNDSGVIYSDTPPGGIVADGGLWFDSQNIRLNIRHQGAWIYPDRVEDTALKSALFNAVSTATDFDTLKIKLQAALI